jgi:NADP-dependent 3-hydroxy acid dehydrogenase YdfG
MHSRTFTSADQVAFEELSGDNNPLHMDPVAARRFLFGRSVVHGIHLVLWALDDYARDGVAPFTLRAIKAQFLRPVGVEEVVCYSIAGRQDQRIELELTSSGVLSTKIQIEFEPWQQRKNTLPAGLPERRSPRDLAEGDVASQIGHLNLSLDPELAATLFPRLTQCISAVQIGTLLATSRLVGTECPGLNSVYFELDLSGAANAGQDRLDYRVTRYEKVLGLVVMQVHAPGLAGTVKAFVRPSVQRQAAYVDLKPQVASTEFAHQRALVVGGSRGLGEIAVKLLCAGGANVKFTYHRGQEDAVRLRDEIISKGGTADCLQLDVLRSDDGSFINELGIWRPTHLCFFATPFIFSPATGAFSLDRFDRFCAYYVHGFANLVSQLVPLGLRHVLYPSSVFIDEVPPNMGEYVAAKAAGEMLCNFLGKTHRGIIIQHPRLPRLATDQTVSLRQVNNADPVPVILNALRSFSVLATECETVSLQPESPSIPRPL